MPPLPSFIRTNKRTLGIYASGALFAIGWWFFLDAVMISSISMRQPPPDEPWNEPATRITFSDWVPGLCATIGMIVVNLIDKSHLGDAGGAFTFGGGSGGGWGEGGVQWRARMFLFVGFAFLAGGLAGSFTVLTVKYLVPALPPGYEYYGVANVVSRRDSLGAGKGVSDARVEGDQPRQSRSYEPLAHEGSHASASKSLRSAWPTSLKHRAVCSPVYSQLQGVLRHAQQAKRLPAHELMHPW